MTTLEKGNVVYDPDVSAMATVSAVLTSSPSGQSVELTPTDGGPTWSAPSSRLQLQPRALGDAG